MTTGYALKERLDAAKHIIEEVESMANEPMTLDFTGTVRLVETEDGITIQIMKMGTAPVRDVLPMTPPIRVRRRRGSSSGVGRKKIINASNIPGFKAFVLKDSTRTRRAAMVMRAYRAEPEGVPGREIITWAKEHPQYASEVVVEYNDEKIPLGEFVNQIWPN